jgi:hypothetical protein
MKHRHLTFAFALLLAPPLALAAQVTERPVPFDSIGRVPSITPRLAEQLHLGPPLWPVLGSFVSAQLFSKSTGGYTLVVVRPDGAFDRYDLSGEAAEGLRAVVATALASGERAGFGEQTTIASEPAGNAFVRNQALLGLFLYGPSAMTFIGGVSKDPSSALTAELLAVGGSFAAALARRNMLPPVTTAQNHLSTHASLHGAALGEALVYIAGGAEESGHGAALLAGSVGGTLLGLHYARNMTDAEAASAGYAADLFAGGSLGIMGAAGLLQNEHAGRPAAAIASAAMLGGYLLGPRYPGRASYTVTAGDVRAMTVTTAIGVAAAAIPFVDQKGFDGRALSTSLAGGMVVGALAGERFLARPRDHTSSDATLLWTGAGVGAFLGGGVAALGDASAQPAFALAVGGALLGTIATEAAIRPRAAGRRILSGRSETQSAEMLDGTGTVAREPAARRTQITFDPIGAVFAATSKVGTFSVLRVSF